MCYNESEKIAHQYYLKKCQYGKILHPFNVHNVMRLWCGHRIRYCTVTPWLGMGNYTGGYICVFGNFSHIISPNRCEVREPMWTQRAHNSAKNPEHLQLSLITQTKFHCNLLKQNKKKKTVKTDVKEEKPCGDKGHITLQTVKQV